MTPFSVVDLYKYSDQQPRDGNGRWVSSGGGNREGTPKPPKPGIASAKIATPEEQARAQDGLREFVSFSAKFQGDNLPEGWKTTPMTLQRDYAKEYEFDRDTFAGKAGPAHQCYMNSGRLALANPDLTYVEGYVSVKGVPIEHAWVVNSAGRVIDPTIRNPEVVFAYRGVPIRTEYLSQTILRTGVWGILDVMTNQEIFKDDPKTFVSGQKRGKLQPVYLHKYSEDQPRDENGRWSGGGGSGPSSSDPTSGKPSGFAEIERDNPGGSWEKFEKERAAERYSAGFKISGSLTATLRGRMPTERIAGLRGLNNEQEELDLLNDFKAEAIRDSIRSQGVQRPIFVNVNYKGEAFVNEGNHRAALAHHFKQATVPVYVGFYAGGENAPGPWNLNSLLQQYGKI